MSMAGSQQTRSQGGAPISTDAIAMICVLVAAVLAMIFFATGRSQEVRRAPSGFDGLSHWLAVGGLDAQSFAGGWTIPAEEVGLNILPIYDAALKTSRTAPTTKEELLLQRDEFDMEAGILREKAEMAPTLFVLPKWRSGVRLTGLAHPVLLIGGRDTASVLSDLLPGSDLGRVRHIAAVQNDFDYTASDGRRLTAQLYVAQTFEGEDCSPIVGRVGAMVLGRCPAKFGGETIDVHVLADPDLFNNHGLRLGDNALIARDFVAELAGENRVIVDYSQDNWLVEEVTYDHPDRTWADLARFFAFPFSLLWLGAGLTLALFIWRGSARFGPMAEGEEALAASKTIMIGARARLMRLSGQDGALLHAYARARVASVAHRLLGPKRSGETEAALLRFAARRDPALAERLASVLSRIRNLPAYQTPETAIAYVDELETLLEQLNDDT